SCAWAQTTQPAAAEGWRPLCNGKDLTGWYTFLQGEKKGEDATHVFSVDPDGAIHVYASNAPTTRPTVGYLATNEEFSNYRVRLQYKWGDKRFGARPTAKRNAGLLYDIVGPDAVRGGQVWPHCIQCQIQDGITGDIIAMGTSVTTAIDPATAN